MFCGKIAHALSEFLIVVGQARPVDYTQKEIDFLNNKVANVYLNLAVKYMYQDQWPRVIDYTLMYLAHKSDSLKGQRLLAFAYASNKQYDLAETYYNKCLAASPDNYALRADFAYMLESMGNFSKAYGEIKQASHTAPSVTALYVDRAWMAETCKDYAAALISINAAIDQSPNSPGLWIHKGRILVALGKYGEAKQVLDRALQLEPDSIEAKLSLKQIPQNVKP